MSVLIDRRGRPYTPIMLPERRIGVPPANAGKTYPAEIYTPQEVAAIMRAAGRGRAGARLRALIALFYRCGLRAAEGLALEGRDIDTQARTVTVRHGKGNKRRVVGLDPETEAHLRVWLDIRAELGVARGRKVFCTFSRDHVGQPFQYTCLAEHLRRAGQRAGLEKRVHAHGFRHTFAVELLREGVTPMHIMKALGHTDLGVTMRYLDHLMPGEVVEIMSSRQWAPSHVQLDVFDVLEHPAAAA